MAPDSAVLAAACPAWLVATSAAATFLLAGCASLEPLDHPQEWSSSGDAVLANGCPDLSGTYATRAAGAYPANVEVYPPLNEVLGPGTLLDAQQRDRPWPASPGATTTTFTASGDWLFVRFRDEAAHETVLKFKRKRWWGGSTGDADAMYQCRELELGLTLGFDGARKRISAVPYVFAEGDVNFVFLSKARDGSLIVNYRTDRVFVTGALVGSQARWVGSVWWRYPLLLLGQ